MAEPTDGRKKAPAAPPADDITPVPAAGAGDRVAELERELAAARAEVERLKAAPPAFGPGKRFRVGVEGGPVWVVQPEPGEHPVEAFKRATGVLNSANPFDVAAVADETPLGAA